MRLIDFTRLLIGDTKPFLDPEGLEHAIGLTIVDPLRDGLGHAIGEHRELWTKLYRVNAGLEELEAPSS